MKEKGGGRRWGLGVGVLKTEGWSQLRKQINSKAHKGLGRHKMCHMKEKKKKKKLRAEKGQRLSVGQKSNLHAFSKSDFLIIRVYWFFFCRKSLTRHRLRWFFGENSVPTWLQFGNNNAFNWMRYSILKIT